MAKVIRKFRALLLRQWQMLVLVFLASEDASPVGEDSGHDERGVSFARNRCNN